MDETFVFAHERDDGGAEVLVNFGMHAGRDATRAEIERLGQQLLQHTAVVDIVCEQRYRFDRERELSVYQVRIETPEDGALRDTVIDTVDAWARDCVAERRLMTP